MKYYINYVYINNEKKKIEYFKKLKKENRKEFENIRSNLKCPFCDFGTVFLRESKRGNLHFVTKRDKHDIDCKFHEENYYKSTNKCNTKESKFINKKWKNKMNTLFSSIEKNEKSEENLKIKDFNNYDSQNKKYNQKTNIKYQETIPQHKLTKKLNYNDSDYGSNKIYYGTIKKIKDEHCNEEENYIYFSAKAYNNKGQINNQIIRIGIGCFNSENYKEIKEIIENSNVMNVSMIGKMKYNLKYNQHQITVNVRNIKIEDKK